MINIAQRLKADLTVIELIKLLKSASEDLTGTGQYTLIPSDTLATASRTAMDTINYCQEHEFIRVEKLGSKCYEFHVTSKGLAFLNSQA
ncbi:hypothetical protein JMN32_03460 [Fulvivirga sp. 29W222]|uniref:Uncharacterized protein n=1 Tax=Fulvivirga marina TaxID=2494733 RepID=A0A937FTD7_9BACT|nr:hypothetical protein [Fulvivirga marina]MBL6445349.1 hypothetical protein [Fulvivirga marina]